MPRYVILRHELPPGQARSSHYDVMFEAGEVLRTWAVNDPPDAPGEQAAEPLPDHRRNYLTYEGPVSGDRGEVRRWDEGTYVTRQDDAAALVVDVRGTRLGGTVTITAEGRFSYVRRESP